MIKIKTYRIIEKLLRYLENKNYEHKQTTVLWKVVIIFLTNLFYLKMKLFFFKLILIMLFYIFK